MVKHPSLFWGDLSRFLGEYHRMFELVRSNDPVLISWLRAQFADAGIDVLVLDEHMSIMDGSIQAIPRRIMVADEDKREAQSILAEADRIATGEGA